MQIDFHPIKKQENSRMTGGLSRAGINSGFDKISKTPLAQIKKIRPNKIIQIAAFALFGIILIGLLQGVVYLSRAKKASKEIQGVATSVYSDLSSAGKNLGQEDFVAASQLFNSAQTNVQIAKDRLDQFKLLEILAPQANSANHILSGASLLAAAGGKLTDALNILNDLKISSNGFVTDNLNDKIKDNRKLLEDSRQLVLQASAEFNAAGSLPSDYAATLDQAKLQVSQLALILEKLVGMEDLYLGFFDGQKTYLLVFQNYDEARATGGFIGTYGLLKTDKGRISDLKISSIYDLDGRIYKQIAAPGPFQPAIPRWGIRDANWFADFPTSAHKLLQFFEYGDQTADGVISATPKLFEDLLRLTGPIEMDQYGVTLTPENFQTTVQFETSVNYDKKLNQPKKLLSDFAPIMLNRLTNLDKTQWFQLLQILEDSFKQREVLLYMKNPDMEQRIKDLGFGGELLDTDYDYLSINNSNLGGTKSDLSMEQTANLATKVEPDGSIVNTLKISRKNAGITANRDYMRVLVPLGAEFISADGFDKYIYYPSASPGTTTDPDLSQWDKGFLNSDVFVRRETGKSEFAGWVETNSGQTQEVTISYKLPFKFSTSYSLLLQKQSGAKAYEFDGSLDPNGTNLTWTSNEISRVGNILTFKSNSAADDFWGFVAR